MRLVQRELDDHSNVTTVWFNAWRYEQEEHPIVPLVGTIVRELERHKSFREQLKGGGQSLMRALRAIAYGFSAKSKVKVPGFAEIEASFVAKDMIEREEHLVPDPLLDRSLYYEAFENLGAVRLRSDYRIVVLIDDLDRCFPDQAIRLLESIKLVLSQPGFIFLLGVARQVIEGYLQHRYSNEYGISNFKGELYLDKVVQLPFFIPPNAGRMTQFSEAMLERVTPDVRNQIAGILPTIGEAFGGNPRAVIRFINNVLVDLAINADLADRSIMERIPVEFFALSRCVEQRWPELFSALVSSDELAEEAATWDRAAMRANADSNEHQRASLAASLLSDRNLQTLFRSAQGKSWLTESALRTASVNFLRAQQRVSEKDKVEVVRRYDAFMSYAQEDRGEVSRIAEILTDSGLSLFMDTALTPGVDWRLELERGLADSRGICVFVGPSARLSNWREKEVELALSSSTSKRVIPILLPRSKPEDVPSFLTNRQWLDLRAGITTATVRPLIEALRR
jgi:hypothetical protein